MNKDKSMDKNMPPITHGGGDTTSSLDLKTDWVIRNGSVIQIMLLLTFLLLLFLIKFPIIIKSSGKLVRMSAFGTPGKHLGFSANLLNDTSLIYAETIMDKRNADKLFRGASAIIKFDSLPDITHVFVKGRVKSIHALNNQKSQIIIEFPNEMINKYDKIKSTSETIFVKMEISAGHSNLFHHL